MKSPDVSNHIVKIPQEKYDELFEKWVTDNKVYVDSYNYSTVMKKFDEYLGLTYHSNFEEHDDCYSFNVSNGPKAMLTKIMHGF
jgi:hypothetical protein